MSHIEDYCHISKPKCHPKNIPQFQMFKLLFSTRKKPASNKTEDSYCRLYNKTAVIANSEGPWDRSSMSTRFTHNRNPDIFVAVKHSVHTADGSKEDDRKSSMWS
ncbi:hypothetical protein [Haloarchaeobius salinus]|uniref:hypothetical protein n=1 Tax=Haloarchaeobius salinus TaxID=1198298 RepID=UPI00210B39E6|nr:hypothetical protein [Haloarchaeobius salinus]